MFTSVAAGLLYGMEAVRGAETEPYERGKSPTNILNSGTESPSSATPHYSFQYHALQIGHSSIRKDWQH